MRVGIYKEICSNGLGGGEHVMAVLAEALARRHEVELVHHYEPLTAEMLARFSHTDLGGVRCRYVEPEWNALGQRYNFSYSPRAAHSFFGPPWRRSWHAS